MLEEDFKKFLYSGILVYPISDLCCPKCKVNQSHSELCPNCEKKKYKFKELFALGYYIPRWRRPNTQIRPEIFKNRLGNINSKFLFSELIIYAKGQKKVSKILKNLVYEFFTQCLTQKLQKQFKNISEKVNFLVHVPKENENYNLRYDNHSIYYASYLSKALKIPFERYILQYEAYNKPISIFHNEEKIYNSNIMIIDDVYTNGDTKGPISNLLMEYGAKNVYIGVIGRNINKNYYCSSKPIELKNK